MDDINEMEIVTENGVVEKVNLITYLTSDDGARQFIVYTKNEKYGNDNDKIIYVSKLYNKDDILYISEISDDVEWNEVQKLLRRIANVA